MGVLSKQQLQQLTDSVAALATEMREGFAELKHDVTALKQDVANLQDSAHNHSVNLEDLDRRMEIGFAETTARVGNLLLNARCW